MAKGIQDWMQLKEAPKFAIGRTGEVKNLETGEIVPQQLNQSGQPFVSIFQDRVRRTLSPHVLVGMYFDIPKDCPSNMDPLTFNQLIHKNGVKADCRVENLAWRPRWFVIEFHKQFYKGYEWSKHVGWVRDDGVRYETSRQIVEELGVIEKNVGASAFVMQRRYEHNEDQWPVSVFPQNHFFFTQESWDVKESLLSRPEYMPYNE